MAPMRTVDAVEATNQWDSLLDLVERGEEITITRHGKPVARLVRSPLRNEAARRAIEEINEVRKGVTLGGISNQGFDQRRPKVSGRRQSSSSASASAGVSGCRG